MGLFGEGVGRICAVAAAKTAAEMEKQVRLGLRETPTVELRLDWLANDGERKKLLAWVSRGRRRSGITAKATFIATCRRRVGGGKFAGSAEAELKWLRCAQGAGCLWGDLEVETLQSLPGGVVPKEAGLPRILLSVHDFKGTRALSRGAISGQRRGLEAVKVAVRARSIADSVRVLRFARGRRNCVAVPMGEIGQAARILALREGSTLAYAPVGEATAPGQVSLGELKDLYRAHALGNGTRVFGVVGNPVRHSLSPLLHNTAFVRERIDAVYLPFLAEDLGDFLKAVRDLAVRGFSITLPHKQSILKHLEECEPLAAEIGAVNTVVVLRNGSLYGCNTDYVGVLRGLGNKIRVVGSRVLIFGAGGAARAAAFALARNGASVAICARRKRAARDLARAVGGEVVPRRALRTQRFEAILNATPVGMHPNEGVSPLEARELNCRIVMDLIYRPERTELLRLAAREGIATVSGVEMFLAQGIAQWELWMKRRAPEAAMRQAVLRKLREEEAQAGARRRSG